MKFFTGFPNFIKACHPAFSLIEMLMALLVASLLMAALAPVMTRRLGNENLNIKSVSSNNGNETHGVKIFEYDSINDSDKLFSKYDFTVPAGVHILSIVVQGAGGGGGGSTSGYTSYNNELNTSSSANQTIKIEGNLIGIKNLRVDLTGGGGGGGSAQLTTIDCKDPNLHKYINPTQGNGTQQCVNKFNVGDSGGPAIAAGSIRCVQGETNAAEQAKCLKCADPNSTSYAKCYHIGTYTDCTDDPMGGGYSGCGRTAVQWYVANNSCNAYTGAGLAKGKWRLPKVADTAKWKTYRSALNDGQGANGLQICTLASHNAATYKIAQCGWNEPKSNGCYGSPSNDCDANVLWLGDVISTNIRGWLTTPDLTGYAVTGTSGVSEINNGQSARCLTTDNSAFTFSYKTGGGGGSGARISNYTLPETYNNKKLLETGNTITITRGNAGGGGSGAGVNGANGSPSCITIYDSNNISIFYLCANGGNYGRGATTSTYGAAGAAIATCRIGTSSTNYSNVNCSTIGNGVVVTSKGGSNGVSNISASYNTTVSGGNGGASAYNTSLAGGQGGSGIATKTAAQNTINGKVPSISGSNIPYGAGGGGGTSGRGADSSTPIAGNGGSGYIGFAKITYDIERTGGSGGGGGGGSMAAIASLEVTPGETYEVIAGKGGKGGNVNADGLDGYLSSFKYSNTKTIKGNEGKGGKAGNNESAYGIGGDGGKGGSKTTPNFGYGVTVNEGKDGTKGYDYDFNPSSDKGIKKSIGGNGGKSGIGTEGACGALSHYYETNSYYTKENLNDNCKITNTNADSALYLLNTLIMGTDYGKAGSGGGGGGFESFSLYGVGGNGGNGYVFIKW